MPVPNLTDLGLIKSPVQIQTRSALDGALQLFPSGFAEALVVIVQHCTEGLLVDEVIGEDLL